MDYGSPGFSVQGILQARIPEWVASPAPGDLPDPGTERGSPALQADSSLSKVPGQLQQKAPDCVHLAPSSLPGDWPGFRG